MAQEREAQELREKLTKLEINSGQAHREIVAFCRAILPVLRDHKLDNMAHELGAKLFAIDMIDSETRELMMASPLLAIRVLLESFKGGGR